MKSGLKVFGAYHKSMELFDLVAQDMKTLGVTPKNRIIYRERLSG